MKRFSPCTHRTAGLLLTAAATMTVAHAQGFSRIGGVVTDGTGAAVPAATVVLTNTDTRIATTVSTNGNGEYVFPSLQPAAYSLSITASGFGNFTQTSIRLEADAPQTINATLKVGSASDSVTVSTAPPQIDTTSGTLSQDIGQQQINDLPLNGRNAASLTTLVAGV